MATIARVPKASGIRYKAIIKRPGLPLRTKTFRNKSEAKVWARRIESDLERSVALGDPGLSITLDEAAQRYLAGWHGNDHHRRSQIAWWRQRLGQTRLSEIDASMIREALRAYREGTEALGGRARSPASSNRMKAALSSIHRFAEHQGLAKHNPVRSMVGETDSRHRIRYLSDQERRRLLLACQNSGWNRLNLLVLMAMMTGARKGELKALRSEEIEFRRRTARLTLTNNGDLVDLPRFGEPPRSQTRFRRIRARTIRPCCPARQDREDSGPRKRKNLIARFGVTRSSVQTLRQSDPWKGATHLQRVADDARSHGPQACGNTG